MVAVDLCDQHVCLSDKTSFRHNLDVEYLGGGRMVPDTVSFLCFSVHESLYQMFIDSYVIR